VGETVAPRGNPCRHRKTMQTPNRKASWLYDYFSRIKVRNIYSTSTINIPQFCSPSKLICNSRILIRANKMPQ